MKVGFIAHVPLPGNVGGSIRSMELSKGLSSIGEEVHIYGQLEEKLPDIKNIHFHDYPRGVMELPRAVKSFLQEFRNYDVIYERFQYLFNNVGFVLAKVLGKPYVLEVHGFPVDELRIIWREKRLSHLRSLKSLSLVTAKILPQKMLEWFENRILKSSSLLVVTSEGTRDILIRKGIPENKIKLVPNAVDYKKFHPGIKPVKLREKDEVVVSFVGSLFNQGVDTILGAAKLLQDKNIRFELIGPGPHEYYREIIVRQGLSNVFLFPPVKYEEVPNILAGSDILLAIYSAKEEKFKAGFHYSPIKIFEYLSMEKPVVVSKLKHLERYFSNDKNVFFVYPDSPRALADRILYIMNNKEKAEEVAKNGRTLILQNHTWEKRATILRKYLKSVIT